jgi:hypothetical protein
VSKYKRRIAIGLYRARMLERSRGRRAPLQGERGGPVTEASPSSSALPCVVCANPRAAGNAGQIRWHNAGHPQPDPPPVSSAWSRVGKRLPVTVVIRPGDRVIYEVAPSRWQELPVAALLGSDPRQMFRECARCHRPVLSRLPFAAFSASVWNWLFAR